MNDHGPAVVWRPVPGCVTPQGYRVCKECKRTKTREDRARRGGIYRARAKARRQGGTA